MLIDKYIYILDTKLCKSMNMDPVQMNVKEESKPYACYSSRPTPAHYKETGMKLVKDLLNQNIIARCRNMRSERTMQI